MKPWTERKQIRAALANADVRVGERTLPDGSVLRGVYATRDFAPGDYVASFHGTVISREALLALRASDQARFDQITEYAVETPSKGHLYPTDIDRLGAHLINHSCGPTADWAEYDEQGARLVRAIRPIAVDEEVTLHYRWVGIQAAYEDRRHPCACGAPMCVGTIELYVEMIRQDDGSGGVDLPLKEVAKRLLADIMNGSDANEAVLRGYVRALAAIPSAEVFDGGAFHEKLAKGAEAAVRAALALRADGRKLSEQRLRQIARKYDVNLLELAEAVR